MGLYNGVQCYILFVSVLPGVTSVCAIFSSRKSWSQFGGQFVPVIIPTCHFHVCAITFLGEKKRPFSQKLARLWCLACRRENHSQSGLFISHCLVGKLLLLDSLLCVSHTLFFIVCVCISSSCCWLSLSFFCLLIAPLFCRISSPRRALSSSL